MNEEISKRLFPYDSKYFKEIFDKYINDDDYKKDLKALKSSENLMDEIVSKGTGLNFYIENNLNDNFLKECKLPFFKKLLKILQENNNEEREEKKINENNTTVKFNEFEEENEIKVKAQKTYNLEKINSVPLKSNLDKKTSNDADRQIIKAQDLFVFNKKINMINNYRVYRYCSNVIQSLPSLTYMSVIKIYFTNYPLKIFLSCIYFYTFVTYICDRNNVIEFLESFIFLILVTAGCFCFAWVHYIKENRISMITSKYNNYKENYVCRNFLKTQKEKKEVKNFRFENKKTVEIKKYSKYFFLKSFLTRINEELYDYETRKNGKLSCYMIEYYKKNDQEVNNGVSLSNTNSVIIDNNKKNLINGKTDDIETKYDINMCEDINNSLCNFELNIGENIGNENELLNYILFGNNIYRINRKNLLVGDIIYLSKGDMIPADGILIHCNNMIVNESNILKYNTKKYVNKISLNKYIYEMDKLREKNMGELENEINQLEKGKKLSYFQILNSKIKTRFKKYSDFNNRKKKNVYPKLEDIYNDDKESDDENNRETCFTEINGKINQIRNSSEEYNDNKIKSCYSYFNIYEYSPLLLSESVVTEGTGIMVATCVSKNKQMFHSSIKRIEENTNLEIVINSYSKNFVILILFCCSLCILFIFIHFLVNLIENNMQTYSYNLLMFLLNTIIIEILKYLLLSIDNMPLLLQNCISINYKEIMDECYIIKSKNIFEKVLQTNTIFIDINKYINYKSVLFFFNTEYVVSFNIDLIFSQINFQNNIKSYTEFVENEQGQEICTHLFFSLLIQTIIATSNLYIYNEDSMDIDLHLLDCISSLKLNISHYYIKHNNILNIISNKNYYVISFVFSDHSYMNKIDDSKTNKKNHYKDQLKNKSNVLRIFIRGKSDVILPMCSQYFDGQSFCKDIDKLLEKNRQIEESKYDLTICFAYKEIIIGEKEKEDLFSYKENNGYNLENMEMDNNMNSTYLKYAEMNDFTCISIFVFEKTISNRFYVDYKIIESNNLHIKLFTKYDVEKIKKIFSNFPDFISKLKFYDSKSMANVIKSRSMYEVNMDSNMNIKLENKNSNEKYNSNMHYINKMETNNQRLEHICVDNKRETKDMNITKSILDKENECEKYNLKYSYNSSLVQTFINNESMKEYSFFLNNNVFCNCSKNNLVNLLYISKSYKRINCVVTNNNDYFVKNKELCNIRVCDIRSKDIVKNKSDIILLNRSLYDYIKLRYFSNSMLMNIKLFIEYNICLYICIVALSIISTLINGLEFLTTVQILYIYIIKNIIFHYISCYRKSNYCVGKKRCKNANYSYNVFSKDEISSLISSIVSKLIILIIIFLFGHIFIPEASWDFVSDDIREFFEFSEFSFSNNLKKKRYYNTIRSCIRFKKNLENIKIANNINIKNDYRTIEEWEHHISPNRHTTIIFNVFFLFFFFSYIYIYIKTFLVEIDMYCEQIKTNKKENHKYLSLLKNKTLSKDINNMIKEFKFDEDNIKTTNEIQLSNMNENCQKLYCGDDSCNYCDGNNNEKYMSEHNINITEKNNDIDIQTNSLYSIKNYIKEKVSFVDTDKNKMLFDCLIGNYKTILSFILLLLLHIIIIQYGSFVFNFHVKGLTLVQWGICFLFCVLDFVLYYIISFTNLFRMPTNFIKSFHSLSEARKRTMFDAMNDYKRSYISQRYKYDRKLTTQNWI
ncbi:E1-E2 ATPase, putative [Plasmodium berghei]|uniref:E1-E2 ATPase, putative n=2 Tax=Plasmodium berghei TaxID=5821 RepID=A0A509AQP0_PLABA|nr:E1-E2 ATPase, putative [Plasmodium berghei ANKA]CXJ04896.1 E1-E2 ATPase, putative [Plasmodium berghei]SCL98746.1 E1-E2 ATPase, putative [Plasmodium berghei]SCM16889.1 E1-E2 ATPase, putative [Plasmodium berghei]SCM18687.1 E1-E2 ATPase, putative [Plasmodium berghei]SCN28122.1 E1-E2 ATPase, putative [Plasmodium berghei]|eukprot:XP_034423772.1 E1-E2 ATPase, putative [Plasmodium berghei ANKA]